MSIISSAEGGSGFWVLTMARLARPAPRVTRSMAPAGQSSPSSHSESEIEIDDANEVAGEVPVPKASFSFPLELKARVVHFAE